MNFNQNNNNKPERGTVRIKNAEASATINAGQPVCLVMNGTDDGLAVVLPGTGGATKAHSLFFGVATENIATGNFGNSMVYGFHPAAVFYRGQTRAASTDSWASAASVAQGALLAIDTAFNAMVSNAASVGATAYLPFALLGESIASAASSASATSDTRLSISTAQKVILRAM